MCIRDRLKREEKFKRVWVWLGGTGRAEKGVDGAVEVRRRAGWRGEVVVVVVVKDAKY